MTRPAVAVREATLDDVPALVEMWAELRDMGGRIERVIPGPDAGAMRAPARRHRRRPDVLRAGRGGRRRGRRAWCC